MRYCSPAPLFLAFMKDTQAAHPETIAPARRKRGRPAASADPVAPDEHLLALAIKAFAEIGYEGASIRDLSRRLKVSHNLIPSRFGSKENLWRRAVDFGIADSMSAMNAIFDAQYETDADRLRDLVLRFIDWAATNPDSISLVNTEARCESWRLDYLYNAYVSPFHLQLDRLLARIARKRHVRPISSATFMVLLVQGVGNFLALGPLMQRLAPEGRRTPADAKRDAATIANVLLSTVLGEENIPVREVRTRRREQRKST
ncbi:TetR/AcrR family transcriptional regulator [Paraburkholderia caffeinilytica]|nr:TetR/AcrR family transcriptional regulator [Paraburkholderia caffeinilytica]CAB3779947.1 hypothetical protein LMG28690_00849 [Paraburkholderia caffeinilytica]